MEKIILFHNYAKNKNKYMTICKNYGSFINERFITYEDLGLSAPTYSDKVKSSIIDIISNVKGISEKDFTTYDTLKERVEKELYHNDDVIEIINNFEEDEKRINYCAEHIYETYIKNTDIEKNIKTQ